MPGFEEVPIFSPVSLGQEAETTLVLALLEDVVFGEPEIQRRLASYVKVEVAEKDQIILELMDRFWEIPGSNGLFSVFRDFDTVFTILERKGHFVHQFEVFLLGWYLIGRLLMTDRGPSLISRFDSIETLFNAWLLASTAHDFGYPLQIAGELSKKVAELYDGIYMQNLSNRYSSILQKYRLDSEKALIEVKVRSGSARKSLTLNIEKFLSGGIKDALRVNAGDLKELQRVLRRKRNHGYISSMILCRSLIGHLSESGVWNLKSHKWRIDNLRMAASAIALHGLPAKEEEYIKKISFDANPLAYLLLVIDHLQEWDRSVRPHKKWPCYNLLHFEATNNGMHVSYVLTHEKWTASMIKRVGKNIAEKTRVLTLPSPPEPSFNFRLSADFTSSDGHKFQSVILTI